MKTTWLRALQYIRNTSGQASKADFFEDHDPNGYWLWASVYNAGYVTQDNFGKLRLTDLGTKALEQAREKSA